MTTVREIETAVSQLSQDDFTQFSAWFETFEAEVWDSQFERDVKAGRRKPEERLELLRQKTSRRKPSSPSSCMPLS